MVGRLFQLASDNLQAVLDALDEISKIPGSMLWRNTTGWMAVIPEFTGDVPTVDSSGVIAFRQLFSYLAPGEGDMLVYHDGDWHIVEPGTDDQVLVWDGTTGLPQWQPAAAGRKYTLACFVPGALSANQVMLVHALAKDVSTPADFGAFQGQLSEAVASAPATADTDFDVGQALAASPTSFSSVGTIHFAAGDAVATFSTVGHAVITWSQGDVLRIQAPAVPDATLADFAATIVGFET
jgi:hypothetical protein